jgi:hypothetical protein
VFSKLGRYPSCLLIGLATLGISQAFAFCAAVVPVELSPVIIRPGLTLYDARSSGCKVTKCMTHSSLAMLVLNHAVETIIMDD